VAVRYKRGSGAVAHISFLVHFLLLSEIYECSDGE